MKFKTPSFWYRSETVSAPLLEIILRPVSWLYRLLSWIYQNSKKPQKSTALVICVGNIVAGGTGKTPSSVALLETLKDTFKEKKIMFLTRGYGGKSQENPVFADPEKHDFQDIGDEAFLLARHAPVIVSKDRYGGALAASAKGAELIIMDDGLQNPGIVKDLKLIVIDGMMGFGNRKLLPAGPLREPLDPALKKADAFILIGHDKRGIKKYLPLNIPLFEAEWHVPGETMLTPDQRYLAFSGLGYPEKFFSLLRDELKLNLAETLSFPDHYVYKGSDIRHLKEKAQKLNAKLLTTEKDAVRLQPGDLKDIHVVNAVLKWRDPDAVKHFLQSSLAQIS